MGAGWRVKSQFELGIPNDLLRLTREITAASASFTIIHDPVGRFISAWYHLKKVFPATTSGSSHGYAFSKYYHALLRLWMR